tara:strand:+ start:623 stop:952 length:330 start_codon:yes stop_codon:yes gene_type:complete
MEAPTEYHSLMSEVIDWAGDSSDRWSALSETVRSRYAPPLPFSLDNLTPREVLLNWTYNRHCYHRGVKDNSRADISFYKRVVAGLEEFVPSALSIDHGMAKTLALKIKK